MCNEYYSKNNDFFEGFFLQYISYYPKDTSLKIHFIQITYHVNIVIFPPIQGQIRNAIYWLPLQ